MTVNASNVDANSTQKRTTSTRYLSKYKYTKTEGITITKYVMTTHGQSGPITIARLHSVLDIHSPRIITLPSTL